MHIARVGERLPRLQIQFRISRSFRPRNLANLGSKIRFLDSPKGTHPVFQGSLLVVVIMIDGSDKHNCEGGF